MNVIPPNSFRTGPDENGLFGIYGGRFVAETLMPLILKLEQAYKDAKADPSFQAELDSSAKVNLGSVAMVVNNANRQNRFRGMVGLVLCHWSAFSGRPTIITSGMSASDK